MYIYFHATEPCDLPFMPQSHVPYGDRTAPVRCQILQNRTVTVRSYDFYGHRTVAVAFFTHRTMRREVLTRRYNFLMHRTMFQLQTASCGRRRNCTGPVRFFNGIFGPLKSYGRRTVTVGLWHGNLSAVRSPCGRRTVTVRSPYGYRTILAE